MTNVTPPYYAVIFTTIKDKNPEGYPEWSKQMNELVEKQPGYLGRENYSDADGKAVTISYWKDLESVAHWKQNSLHNQAQELGKLKWYNYYRIRICKVERDYEFTR